MSINLTKGQKIDLTKKNQQFARIMVGLGWDPVQKEGGGFFSGLFGGGSPDIDCDASVLMLDQNGKLKDCVFFGKLKSPDGSIKHMGDNLTGDGDGDDEQIMVSLPQVPANIHRLTFVVNIYDCAKRKQDFGMIRNAFIRIFNPDNQQELSKYNLSENYSGKTSLIAGEVYRYNGEWKFAAIGEGTMEKSIKELIQRYS